MPSKPEDGNESPKPKLVTGGRTLPDTGAGNKILICCKGCECLTSEPPF
ncbi:Ras association (RalGDS/AF-6) and pleckstrin homology domains 1 [Apodemus speciosus]|uniref:Ras association (RalGDS/AF-6) and pleckstrin homology domains 1 n=1 Tax=Apodemus speciosus TaxID=105296 RepID=A0ABQ0FW97_APOSI